MWMSSGLTGDPWGSENLMGLPMQGDDDGVNQGPGYFDQNHDY